MSSPGLNASRSNDLKTNTEGVKYSEMMVSSVWNPDPYLTKLTFCGTPMFSDSKNNLLSVSIISTNGVSVNVPPLRILT